MTKSFLLSATALAVVSTFVALEAHAGDLRPVVQPVSQGFTEASHQAAVNTVTLVQAGTPGGMTSAAQGPVDQSDLPPPQQAVVRLSAARQKGMRPGSRCRRIFATRPVPASVSRAC
ncbi:MAG: hypothetical protein WDN06_20170 [Asticcacaulis sp.]